GSGAQDLMVRRNHGGHRPGLRVGNSRNQGTHIGLEGLGEFGNMGAEGLATRRHSPILQRFNAQATLVPQTRLHDNLLWIGLVCDTMKSAAAGAQTERPGSVAGELSAWRLRLTGRIVSRASTKDANNRGARCPGFVLPSPSLRLRRRAL